ncbi:hypothetical protein H5U98_22780 [Mycolicibacterium boenickei]|uniref:Uncharacterized protein n=1 Tax=Mycolicibacterium boenickei TaxID=146017 RepID=A0AAX2ZSC1_9MYCO|nr:hypothetical protein [Mycolicibacterium boenickei]PEG62655.1 hypothetical protein CQY21_02395 [Mycolicibacterium boenickei]UNB98352.1 hypothetical protein H5U98_22780 [Mycolicibacterium boenickei]BBX94141.1 hypothetical protein MBOE_57900 [Mycolicibacterium boenickei]
MMDYDRAFFARNLRPEFLATAAGQQTLEWVDYRDHIWAAALTGERIERRNFDPSLLIALDTELNYTSKQAGDALGKVNPRTVGAFGIFDDLVSAASWGEDLRAGGLGQPIWAAGAAGAGTAAPGGYLARYLRCYAQWRATSLLSDLMEVPDESGSLTVMIEALSARLLPSRASFWWASRELAQLIARHTPNGVLPQQAVNELADYVDTTAQQAHWWDGNCGAVPLSPAARAVAQLCSYPCGSQAEKPFDDIMVKRDIEVHPFIDVDGVIIPAALQHIFESYHVAIFDALRRTHGNNVDTSELFELVCRDTLARLFTTSTRLFPDRMHVYNRAGKQVGETDFAIAHGPVLLLGEVKSKAAPGQVLMNGKRFNDQITETIEQLDTVIDNLANHEGTLVSNGHTVDTTGISTYLGFAVVLHDYGGGIWNSAVLHQARKGRPGFAILRATDLMLLAHTLRDMSEFIEYLKFRQEFIDHTGMSTDEIDILATFLEDSRRFRHRLSNTADITGLTTLLRPRDVDKTLLNSPTPPASSGQWRATVANLPKVGG